MCGGRGSRALVGTVGPPPEMQQSSPLSPSSARWTHWDGDVVCTAKGLRWQSGDQHTSPFLSPLRLFCTALATVKPETTSYSARGRGVSRADAGHPDSPPRSISAPEPPGPPWAPQAICTSRRASSSHGGAQELPLSGVMLQGARRGSRCSCNREWS